MGDLGEILDSFGTFPRSYPLEIGKRYVSNIEWGTDRVFFYYKLKCRLY